MGTFEWTVELRFLVALGLGFLIGLERESTKGDHQGRIFAGVRTFPIISLFGFGSAWLYTLGITFVLPAGIVSLGILVAVAYTAKTRMGRFGSTTEVTALLTFTMGALALLADVWIAMALGVVNAMLLSEKAQLEAYVERLDRVELLAVIKFLLVTAIILPVLPDREYTRFGLNPTRIWQIVILVSSIGFVGYFLAKRFGTRLGLWLSGLLGGIVSSTAVSIASGRIAQQHPERAGSALQASMLAASVMYIRILVLVWVLNASLVPFLWWRLLLLSALGLLLSIGIRTSPAAPAGSDNAALQNPFELRPAMLFAGLFVLLSVATGLLKSAIGDSGILLLSTVVGVVDVDPFILSLIQGTGSGLQIVVSAIVLATMSNTVAKGMYFSVLAPAARQRAVWRYALWAVLHLPLVFL
jgi:uncharacterized membrane protein (DUF4010 family)